jgi:hypothetical protein
MAGVGRHRVAQRLRLGRTGDAHRDASAGVRRAGHERPSAVASRVQAQVYAGGIDDSESRDPEDVKKAHNHVRAALEDLLAGRVVKAAQTEPFGCALAYAG